MAARNSLMSNGLRKSPPQRLFVSIDTKRAVYQRCGGRGHFLSDRLAGMWLVRSRLSLFDAIQRCEEPDPSKDEAQLVAETCQLDLKLIGWKGSRLQRGTALLPAAHWRSGAERGARRFARVALDARRNQYSTAFSPFWAISFSK